MTDKIWKTQIQSLDDEVSMSTRVYDTSYEELTKIVLTIIQYNNKTIKPKQWYKYMQMWHRCKQLSKKRSSDFHLDFQYIQGKSWKYSRIWSRILYSLGVSKFIFRVCFPFLKNVCDYTMRIYILCLLFYENYDSKKVIYNPRNYFTNMSTSS